VLKVWTQLQDYLKAYLQNQQEQSKYVIPALKNYIATTRNVDPRTITDIEAEKFISKNIIDKNANQLDIPGGILSFVGLGDTMNFKIKEPLRKALKAIELQLK